MSSFIPIKGKTGECDPHRPPVPEAYYTKRETDALLATKVSFDQFNNHTLNTTVHITAEERAAWNNKITEPAEEGSAGDVLVTDGEGGRTWSASPTHTATWGQITGTLSNQTDLHTRLTTDETNISNEVTRATSAEGLLGQRITTETTRATNAESVLTSSIAAEVTRATTAETTLTTNLATEVTRATTAESTLQDNIDTEEARAEEAELIIQQNVESEATRAQGAETTLNSLITAEVTRAGVAETQLQSNITAEATTRAAADTTLQTNITNEVTRATGVEATKENVSNKVTEILSTSTHTEYASAKSVYDAISAIPKALVYKGTIGVGGTIQVLPEATEDRGGWTYKVITEAIYPPMTEKASIGDLIVCAWEEEPQPEGTYKWTLIPAGAEKVKDVQINGNSILSDAGVANIPYATSSSIGVVKGNTTYDVGVTNDGSICGYPRTLEQYGGTSNSAVIAKGTIENIKTDLTGRALADTSAPAYTTEQKEAALTRLGAEGKKFYKCTYGTTTAEEISTALTNNLVPYVYNNDIYYFYCGGTASDYYFTNLYGIEVITRTMYCACNKTSSTWTSNYKTLQQSQDRTDDVLTNKTDSTKYPSTKGVFNYAVGNVKVNGTALTKDENGDVNIPNAVTNSGGTGNVGLVRPNIAQGLYMATSTDIGVYPAEAGNINTRQTSRPIVPTNLDYAVKAALTDGVGAAYTTTEQAAARTRINAAEDKFFHCTYGTTTYQQISDAITAGKIPVCVYSVSSSETNDFFTYAGCNSTFHYFTAVVTSGTMTRYIRVNTSNTWSSSGNSIENPYRLREYNPNYVGSTGVGSYNLVAFDVDNRLIQMTTGDTTATTKVPSTVPFRPDVLYYYAGGGKSEGATTDIGYMYSHIYTATVTYMFNEQVPAYHHVYLCGSYDKATGLFTLDNGQTNGVYNKYYKFVPETSGLVLSNYFETGKYYIKIGRSSTTTNTLQVSEEKPMYYFNGTNLVDGYTAGGVTDVQINGTSITQDGVANIPKASNVNLGVVSVHSGYGNTVNSNGILQATTRTKSEYTNGANQLFIGKGTLENIKTDLVGRALADDTAEAYDVATQNKAIARLGLKDIVLKSINDQSVTYSAEGIGQKIAEHYTHASYENPAMVCASIALYGNTAVVYGNYRPQGNCWLLCLEGNCLKTLFKNNSEEWSFRSIILG